MRIFCVWNQEGLWYSILLQFLCQTAWTTRLLVLTSLIRLYSGLSFAAPGNCSTLESKGKTCTWTPIVIIICCFEITETFPHCSPMRFSRIAQYLLTALTAKLKSGRVHWVRNPTASWHRINFFFLFICFGDILFFLIILLFIWYGVETVSPVSFYLINKWPPYIK